MVFLTKTGVPSLWFRFAFSFKLTWSRNLKKDFPYFDMPERSRQVLLTSALVIKEAPKSFSICHTMNICALDQAQLPNTTVLGRHQIYNVVDWRRFQPYRGEFAFEPIFAV